MGIDPNKMPKALIDMQNHKCFVLMHEIYTISNANRERNWQPLKYKGNEKYEALKKSDSALKIELIDFLIEYKGIYQKWRTDKDIYYHENWLADMIQDFLGSLMRQKIDFTASKLIEYIHLYKKYSPHSVFFPFPFHQTMMQLEKLAKAGKIKSEQIAEIQAITKWEDFTTTYDDALKANKRFKNILHMAGGESDTEQAFRFNEEDPFGVFANKTLAELNPEHARKYNSVLLACSGATQAKPSARFLKNVKTLVDDLSIAQFKKITLSLFEYVSTMKHHDKTVHYPEDDYTYTYQVFLIKDNAAVLKGLVWSYAHFYDSKSIGTIAKLCERCFQKIPGVGPASAAIGNACIYTLARSKGMEGVGYLSRLKLVIKQSNTQKLIQKYIDELSEKLNVTPEEVEDLSAQDFGLDRGEKNINFDDYTLRVYIDRVGSVGMQWIKPDGNLQKTVPANVKSSAALSKKLTNVKTEVKLIAKMVTTARDQLDRSMVNNRDLTWDYFQQYYFNHGLRHFLVKDLLWYIESADQSDTILYHEEQWVNLEGNPVDWMDSETRVFLWHPVFCAADEIMAWRNKLVDLQVKQPLKQAFREIYLLTEAEINTRLYSNRMASHIIKQHQFNALTSIRGWKYQLMGWFDDGRDNDIASKVLKKYGLTAEFWIVEMAAEEDYNEAGIWQYVSTDQVRFVDVEGNPVELIHIPKIVLSEILRDVDLFVGVCSVGNDPQWMDNGGHAQHRDYWQSYSFGDLNEIAKTRKTILESLVPKLKIGKVSRIEGKFLIVQGKLRTYKIHIGSTNILMEPNDQYLCIVPSRKKDTSADKVFLPFDGDKGLSLVISKAMLLADDDKITDSTIVSQIGA